MSRNKGRKKGLGERKMISSLLILGLNERKLQDSGKEEKDRAFHGLHQNFPACESSGVVHPCFFLCILSYILYIIYYILYIISYITSSICLF